MSNVGQGVLAVAGGVIGFFAGGPTGALYGFQIGLLAGTVAFPTQGPTVNRPRLSDVGTTQSNVGDPIAWGDGRWPATGEVIWQSDLREVNESTEEGGKGGPSQTVVTPTYFQDFAIGLDDTENKDFGGVIRIWANGKIIYDRRPLQAGESSGDFNKRMALSDSLDDTMTVYLGTEDQLQDPTMQTRMAAKGDAPSAFRGLAYVVFANWQNKPEDGQRMPQSWKFECYTHGAVVDPGTREYSNAVLYDWTPGNPVNPNNDNVISSVGHVGGSEGGYVFDPGASLEVNLEALSGAIHWPALEYAGAVFVGTPGDGIGRPDTEGGPPIDQATATVILYYLPGSPAKVMAWDDARQPDIFGPGVDVFNGDTFYRILDIAGSIDFPNPRPPFDFLPADGGAAGRSTWWNESTGAILATVHRHPAAPLDPAAHGASLHGIPGFVVNPDTGDIQKTGPWTFDAGGNYVVLQQFAGFTPDEMSGPTRYPLNPCLPEGDARDTEIFWTAAYNDAVSKGKMAPGLTWPTDYPVTITGGYYRDIDHKTIETDEVELSEIMRLICRSAGYADADIQTTQIEGRTVIGYMRNTIMSGRGALDPLRSLGFFDIIESDGMVKAVTRGNATARVLTNDDLGAYFDGGTPPAARTSTKPLDLGLPIQVRVHYLSVARDLEADQQLSLPRINSDAVGISDIDLAAVLTDDHAAQIAEVLMNDMYQSRYTEVIALDQSQLELEPTDIIELPIGTESVRCRVIDFTDQSQMLRQANLVRDDPGTYVSIAVGATSVFVPPKPLIPSPLGLLLLDLPALKDSDDDAGFYAATWPLLRDAAFPGGALYRSINGGDAYVKVASFGGSATLGTLLAPLPAEPFDLIDHASVLSVTMILGTLSSVTDDQILSGLNAAAVGADGRWEIVQFKTAAPGAVPGSYVLTDLTRGRRGTEHVIGTSVVGDSFVLLNGTGLARVIQNVSDVGGLRYYKAVGVGGAVESTAVVTFVGHGEALKPFSPVYLSGSRNAGTGDWTLRWIRRGRIGQTMQSGHDIALSETTESYAVDILVDGSPVRTLAASTVSAVYLDADQITDFGDPQTTINFRVTQLSAAVGRGYPSEDAQLVDAGSSSAPTPADFAPAEQNEPVLLTAQGGKVIVAMKGSLGGRNVVGIMASDLSGPAVCVATTYDYAAGAVPDSYFFESTAPGKYATPLVADAGDGSWSFYWRSEPFPASDTPSRRFLYSVLSGTYLTEMTEQSLADDILAHQVLALIRIGGATIARNAQGNILSAPDGNAWSTIGGTTGAFSGALPSTTQLKWFAFGASIVQFGDSGMWLNAAGDGLDWADLTPLTALNALGYGTTLPTEFIDACTDGTYLLILAQSHRDSDGVLVNLIMRSTDSGATWALGYEQVLVLGDLAAGQRFTDILHLIGVVFKVYGFDQFTGAYPQELETVDSGASWSLHNVDTGIAPASAVLANPRPDGAGNVLAIINGSSRIIAPATTPTPYAGVGTSSDGQTFTILSEFEPT